MMNGRLNNIDDLVPEIERIEQKLREMVLVTETKARDNGDYPFNIPFITKSDIYSAFNSTFPSFIGNSIDDDTTVEPVLRESPDVPEVCVTETENSTTNRAYSHRLQVLKSTFKLSAFEIDTLLLCFLPELDSEYQKLFGYLQDDITQKLPTLNFVLQLLCSSVNERIHARHSFLPDSPLLKYKFIELSEEYTGKKSPLITNSLKIDQRIVNYLLGIDALDSRISFFTEVNRATHKLDDVVLADDVKQTLVNCIKLSSNNDLIFSFFGNQGVGKNTTVRAVCNESRLPLLVVDIDRMLSMVIPGENPIPLLFREGLLRNAAINLNGLHVLTDPGKGNRYLYNTLIDELIKYPYIVFVTGERIWEPGHELRRKRIFNIEFTVPSFRDRKTLWQKYSKEEARLDDKVDINDLAVKFQFTGSQILNAAIAARDLATLRGSDTEPVSVQDIYTASRRQSKHNLSRLARKIHPKYTWNDIILQTDQVKQLREICNQVKHYYTVYDEWGFNRKLSLGQGLNVLFAGPSGTGKTMAAEIIAGELGLELYRIDLSAIVSKYIGETEKNLDQVFNEGKTSFSMRLTLCLANARKFGIHMIVMRTLKFLIFSRKWMNTTVS